MRTSKIKLVRNSILLILFSVITCCEKNPKDVSTKAVQCYRLGDFECAEENYRWLFKNKPNDVEIKATLAVILTHQDKNSEAITLYKELINSGIGSFEIFAYYAKSLAEVGEFDDAIEWNYRALSIAPDLVDVRSRLATLLVKQTRKYEALSLLSSFDNELESHGRQPYFKGQRISIETLLSTAAENDSSVIQSAKMNGHFYFVVLSTKNEAIPFMVDTGATYTSMSPSIAESLGLSIPYDAQAIPLTTADQRNIYGKLFIAPELKVGPYLLKNITVVACDTCANLLGQSTLEKFDLTTQKTNALEFLSIKLRSQE